MTVLHSALMLSYIALVLYGAWSDARSLRIPNWLSLALLAAFFPTAIVAGLGLESVAWHLACGAAVLIGGIVLFAFGLFGGGDAKFLAACALWVGWPEVTWLIAAVILVGGGLSILVILLRKGLGLWPDWLVNAARGLFEPGKAVPYGIAITTGALLALPRMDVLPPSWPDLFTLILG